MYLRKLVKGKCIGTDVVIQEANVIPVKDELCCWLAGALALSYFTLPAVTCAHFQSQFAANMSVSSQPKESIDFGMK